MSSHQNISFQELADQSPSDQFKPVKITVKGTDVVCLTTDLTAKDVDIVDYKMDQRHQSRVKAMKGRKNITPPVPFLQNPNQMSAMCILIQLKLIEYVGSYSIETDEETGAEEIIIDPDYEYTSKKYFDGPRGFDFLRSLKISELGEIFEQLFLDDIRVLQGDDDDDDGEPLSD